MEIAEQCANQEIIAILKRHTTSASSGNVRKFSNIIIIMHLIMTTCHNNFFVS
jgi:abortive infection bacteriophage resistance protein